MVRTPPEKTKLMSASWLNLVLGVVVLLTPFFTTTSPVAFWGAIVLGAIVVGLEVYALIAETRAMKPVHITGAETVNLLAGLTVMGFAIFAAASATYIWIEFLAGAVIAAAALYNLVITNQARPTRRTA